MFPKRVNKKVSKKVAKTDDQLDDDITDYSSYLAKYDDMIYTNDNALSLQHPCSSLISGASGSGKTNLLLNLLIKPNLKMTYDEVYLCVPTLDEPAYMMLRDHMLSLRKATLDEVNAQITKLSKENVDVEYSRFTIDDIPENFHHVSDPNDIPVAHVDGTEAAVAEVPAVVKAVATAAPKINGRPKKDAVKYTPKHILVRDQKQKLVIIDDMTGDKVANQKIEALCQKNRKVNTSLIVLNHDLYALPPRFKRNLLNGYVILFEVPTGRMLNLYADDFADGMERDEFKRLYKTATSEPFSFLTIDFKTKDRSKRFRKRLKYFIE